MVKQVGEGLFSLDHCKLLTDRSKALVIAGNERIFQHIKIATYGIIFLGTPHRGSGKADIATVVADVIKTTYPGIKTQILESLRRDSIVLRDLADDFRNIHSQLEIVSCYELKPKKVGLVSLRLP